MQVFATLASYIYPSKEVNLTAESPATIPSLEWKNPGMSCPEDRDAYLTVDQERANRDTDMLMVLTQKITNKGRQIIDIGCGSGNSSFYLFLKAHPSSTILGCDTHENTRFAKTRYSGLCPDGRLSFQEVASPLELPKAPKGNGWDIAKADALFSWIPIERHTEVLVSIYQILVPGGEVFVRTQAVQDRPYRRASEDVMQREEWKKFFADYHPPYTDQTAEGFEECFKAAGFVGIKASFIEDEFIFPDKEAMARYFCQWLPPLSRIVHEDPSTTNELRWKFTCDVIDLYCDIGGYSGEGVPLTFPAVLVSAKKKEEVPITPEFIKV